MMAYLQDSQLQELDIPIDTQPRSLSHRTPRISDQQAVVRYENGEQILFTGECASNELKNLVRNQYEKAGLLCLELFIGMVVCSCVTFPCIGICCGAKASKIWRLYLTKTSIWFTKFKPALACCCCCRLSASIDLRDINDIRVKTRVGEHYIPSCSTPCCHWWGIKGEEIHLVIKPPITVQIEFKEGVYPTSCCGELPGVIELDFCKNATEFVDAVKKQMEEMQRCVLA